VRVGGDIQYQQLLPLLNVSEEFLLYWTRRLAFVDDIENDVDLRAASATQHAD
jgi:hypothetical protein